MKYKLSKEGVEALKILKKRFPQFSEKMIIEYCLFFTERIGIGKDFLLSFIEYWIKK